MYYHRNENCIVYLKLNWIKVEVTVESRFRNVLYVQSCGNA